MNNKTGIDKDPDQKTSCYRSEQTREIFVRTDAYANSSLSTPLLKWNDSTEVRMCSVDENVFLDI